MSTSYKHIQLETREGIAFLTLNRPPLNWLNIEMMQEINQALEALAGDDGLKALVFRASGKAFCVGVEVEDHMGDKAGLMIEVFHGIFHRIDALGVPTVAVVEGSALGGGCELATYCDMVLATERAKFGQPEIQVGVFPPIAALILPRMIGRKQAMEMILTGETWSAQEALQAGLVNKVVAAEQVEEALGAIVRRLEGLSPVVLRLAKKAVIKGWDTGAEEGLRAIEDIYMKELMATEDAAEGLKAFVEKRRPVWKGR